MKYDNMKYMILLMLLACTVLTACIDENTLVSNEEDLNGIPEGFKNGYSLNLAVTVDDMGGSATTGSLKKWEDYIDPEKFRVLFFDHNDHLLFESKSRWVKKLNANDNRWLVSVPIFTYGNDVYKEGEWPWEKIRTALTSNSFKVAILANRPEMEWYPGKLKNTNPDLPGWIDNTGPHWTPKDFGKKNVFDLHHCQYDPIYHGKGGANGYYDFIMGNWEGSWSLDTIIKSSNGIETKFKPEMGATSSWLDWTTTNEQGYMNTDNNTPLLTYIHPNATHPIPMYGIQRFDKITGWEKGTPFYLSDDIPGGDNIGSGYKKQTIWLLRSVVKLELLIPKQLNGRQIEKPKYVAMCYPNIYARCEPMDVWTSTDSLWNRQHDNNNEKCEMTSIMNYGPVVQQNQSQNANDFKKKMSWFYGVWKKEKKWNFANNSQFSSVENETTTGLYPTPYPRIFNSCIQRNSVVVCEDKKTCLNEMYPEEYGEDYDYWHYVVYTGERDINDPSSLPQIGTLGGGKATVQYWVFEKDEKLYGLPITNYQADGNPAIARSRVPDDYDEKQPNNYVSSINADGNYLDDVAKLTRQDDRDKLPWPLIRNHVYTLTLGPQTNSANKRARTQELSGEAKSAHKRAQENNSGLEFVVKSEDRYTKSFKSQ